MIRASRAAGDSALKYAVDRPPGTLMEIGVPRKNTPLRNPHKTADYYIRIKHPSVVCYRAALRSDMITFTDDVKHHRYPPAGIRSRSATIRLDPASGQNVMKGREVVHHARQYLRLFPAQAAIATAAG